MKIDNVIKSFYETYNREAMESIDRISKEIGLIENGHSINAFNIIDAFDKMESYMKGYANYKITEKTNPNASSQSDIKSLTYKFIDSNVFSECKLGYNEIPAFIESYIKRTDSLIKTLDEIKESMSVADIDQESIGDVNDMADHFVEKLQESFNPVMDKILWASGYNARQRLRNEKVQPKPVFL